MKWLFSIFCLGILSGCLTTQVNLLPVKGQTRHDQTYHFYVFGLFPQKTILTSSLCSDIEVPSRIETKTTFLNGVCNFFTLGLYSPKTLVVECVDMDVVKKLQRGKSKRKKSRKPDA